MLILSPLNVDPASIPIHSSIFNAQEDAWPKIMAELKIVWLNNWVIEWGFYYIILRK